MCRRCRATKSESSNAPRFLRRGDLGLDLAFGRSLAKALRSSGKPMHPRILEGNRNALLPTDADGVARAAGLGIGEINVEQAADRRTEFFGVADHLHGVADEIGRFSGQLG